MGYNVNYLCKFRLFFCPKIWTPYTYIRWKKPKLMDINYTISYIKRSPYGLDKRTISNEPVSYNIFIPCPVYWKFVSLLCRSWLEIDCWALTRYRMQIIIAFQFLCTKILDVCSKSNILNLIFNSIFSKYMFMNGCPQPRNTHLYCGHAFFFFLNFMEREGYFEDEL